MSLWERLATRVWGERCPTCGERVRLRECHYALDHADLDADLAWLRGLRGDES